jgi:hypothetical protein
MWGWKSMTMVAQIHIKREDEEEDEAPVSMAKLDRLFTMALMTAVVRPSTLARAGSRCDGMALNWPSGYRSHWAALAWIGDRESPRFSVGRPAGAPVGVHPA